MKISKLRTAWIAVALWLMPLVTLAQVLVPNPGGLPGSGGSTATSVVTGVIVGILLPIAGIIAVLFLIIGGFQYMFAGANEDLAAKGRKTVTNAVIGLVIIILSYVIVTVVANTLQINPTFQP